MSIRRSDANFYNRNIHIQSKQCMMYDVNIHNISCICFSATTEKEFWLHSAVYPSRKSHLKFGPNHIQFHSNWTILWFLAFWQRKWLNFYWLISLNWIFRHILKTVYSLFSHISMLLIGMEFHIHFIFMNKKKL